ncbi:MAG TPA: hypothetical protein VHV83_17205 [Armatimonadota bacterium]|nr:hypothetical protein [Armatimonadota bacterium]
MPGKPQERSWTVNFAAQHSWRVVIALLVIFLALFAVAEIGQSVVLTILAGILLLGSIIEYVYPSTYTLNEDGIHANYLLSHRILPWSQVRRVYLSRNGIKLSPLVSQSWAENFRGVLLRTTDRECVLVALREWLDYTGVTPEFIEEQ